MSSLVGNFCLKKEIKDALAGQRVLPDKFTVNDEIFSANDTGILGKKNSECSQQESN